MQKNYPVLPITTYLQKTSPPPHPFPPNSLSLKSGTSSHLMCAEKTGGFNLVNYRHSSGVYHEQETEDLHRRI